jgi:stalled ribosome alternative rescue factor ArfA
LQRGELAPLS